MNEKFELLINKYLDGELSQAEMEELRNSTSKDPALKRVLLAQIQAHEILSKLQPPEAPEKVSAKIMRKLAGEKKKKSESRFFYSMLILLTALALISFTVPFLNSSKYELFNFTTIFKLHLPNPFGVIGITSLKIIKNPLTLLLLLPSLFYLLYEELNVILKLKGIKSGKLK